MDFNQLMGNMGGFCSENRYTWSMVEVTPEEFAFTGPNWSTQKEASKCNTYQGKGMKQDGILAKLLSQLNRRSQAKLIRSSDAQRIQETVEILSRRTKNNPVLQDAVLVNSSCRRSAQAIVNGDSITLKQRNHLHWYFWSRSWHAITVVALKKIFKIWSKKSRLWEMSFSSLMKLSPWVVAQMVKALKVLSLNLLFHVGIDSHWGQLLKMNACNTILKNAVLLLVKPKKWKSLLHQLKILSRSPHPWSLWKTLQCHLGQMKFWKSSGWIIWSNTSNKRSFAW